MPSQSKYLSSQKKFNMSSELKFIKTNLKHLVESPECPLKKNSIIYTTYKDVVYEGRIIQHGDTYKVKYNDELKSLYNWVKDSRTGCQTTYCYKFVRFKNNTGIEEQLLLYYQCLNSKRLMEFNQQKMKLYQQEMKQYKIDIAEKSKSKNMEETIESLEKLYQKKRMDPSVSPQELNCHYKELEKMKCEFNKKESSAKAIPKKPSAKAIPKKPSKLPKVFRGIIKGKIKNKNAIKKGKERGEVVRPVYGPEKAWRNTDFELIKNREINGDATGIDDEWLENDKEYKGPVNLISSNNSNPGNMNTAIYCDRSFNPRNDDKNKQKFMKWYEDNNFESTEDIVKNANRLNPPYPFVLKLINESQIKTKCFLFLTREVCV